MDSIHTALKDNQKLALRFIAKKRDGLINRDQVFNAIQLTPAEYDHLLDLLIKHEAVDTLGIDDGIFASAFHAKPAILELVRQLDDPPLKDYWHDYTAKFRSKRWSVCVMLVIGVISFVGGFVAIVRSIIDLLRK